MTFRRWPTLRDQRTQQFEAIEGRARVLLLIYIKLDLTCSPGAALRRPMLRCDSND
jgi:hypothetical protein